MGIRIGGSIGPVSASMPLVPRGSGKAVSGTLPLLIQLTYWVIWIPLKYTALVYYYAGLYAWKGIKWLYGKYQERQAARAAELQAVRQRADEQNAAYLRGEDEGTFGRAA